MSGTYSANLRKVNWIRNRGTVQMRDKCSNTAPNPVKLAELVKHNDYLKKTSDLAEDPNTKFNILGKISFHEQQWLRDLVETNPTVKSHVRSTVISESPLFLVQMADSPISFIRAAAAKNPNTLWESVAIALSKMPMSKLYYNYQSRSEFIKLGYSVLKYDVYDTFINPKIEVLVPTYSGPCLQLVNDALAAHRQYQSNILGRLEILNKNLFDASFADACGGV
jgi:hypothetical protein